MFKTGMKAWAKWMFYPLVRTAQDVSTSVNNTRENLAKVKEQRQEKVETAKAVDAYLDGMTADEKFTHIAELNKWTAKELENQLIAVRRSRIALLGFGVFGSVLILGASFAARFESVGSNIVLAMAAVMCVAMLMASCAALALRFSWHEYSLTNKVVLPFADYIKMGGIFKRLFY
jgi:hypothetical protein